MARIRYLKPEFFKDEDLSEHPYWIRLLYAGLWNIADKEGRLEDRSRRIKVEIFPYDTIDVEKGLQALSKTKTNSNRPFILRYTVNDKKYIQILSWDEHQKPHHTEKESKIPIYSFKGNGEGNGEGNGKAAQSECEVKQPLNNVSLTVKNIIEDLNQVLGTTYKTTSHKNQELIKSRLNEGFILEDFKAVHRKMLKLWGNDQKMCQFLRPITLYSNKFESYLNMREPTTKLTESGIKAYMVGQEWLKKEQEDVG